MPNGILQRSVLVELSRTFLVDRCWSLAAAGVIASNVVANLNEAGRANIAASDWRDSVAIS